MAKRGFKWEEKLVGSPFPLDVSRSDWMGQVRARVAGKHEVGAWRRLVPWAGSVALVVGLVMVGWLAWSGGPQSKVSDNSKAQQSQPLLTTEEQEIYSVFKRDLNEEHLRGLDPISIAKLYVQARIYGDDDVVYGLYTDREGHVQWSKEEQAQVPKTETLGQIRAIYRNIENGTFVQMSDYEGYIEYKRPGEAHSSGFQMIKDEDGIWNVAFMPIQ
ncbi:hypothetical protein [Paenibacillus koleovorans]|uniref:hypothetical protein n=1 Tax=Paenibacillus koleovorans TaxID=121608 RepID=UPI000FD8F428|nr:hypothetical protein [Paenibacillus koleovorans]